MATLCITTEPDVLLMDEANTHCLLGVNLAMYASITVEVPVISLSPIVISAPVKQPVRYTLLSASIAILLAEVSTSAIPNWLLHKYF